MQSFKINGVQAYLFYMAFIFSSTFSVIKCFNNTISMMKISPLVRNFWTDADAGLKKLKKNLSF